MSPEPRPDLGLEVAAMSFIRKQLAADQQRALVYGAETVQDLDVNSVGPQNGLIVGVGQLENTLSIRFGHDTLLVEIGKSTRIERSNGKKGTIADLDTGDTVQVQGVSGLAVGDNTGLGSGVIWERDGMVYAVGGTLPQDQVLKIANALQ